MADTLPREFRFNGTKLADPNPNMSAEEVRAMYEKSGYGTLKGTSVVGPEVIHGKNVFTFKQAVATKG